VNSSDDIEETIIDFPCVNADVSMGIVIISAELGNKICIPNAFKVKD
jgi:hypothetical protein